MDQPLTHNVIKEYIWAKYIDIDDVAEELDEAEILRFLEDYYSKINLAEAEDSFYYGILLFERAFEEPDKQEKNFFLARRVFQLYRLRTGETDWDAIEDRLTDIEDYFEQESADLEALSQKYLLPAPVEEIDPLEAMRSACPPEMTLVPGEEVILPDGSKETLDPFFIDRYPVTNGEFRRFLEATQYRAPKYWNQTGFKEMDQPVVGVSYFDAEKFAEWAGKALPTQAQWVAAGRGPSKQPFPWGDETDASLANCLFKGDDPELEVVGRHPGGSSESGVEDLIGGVWEWTDSWLDGTEEFRIIKGGSYVDPFEMVNLETVLYASPKEKIDNIGFRCVRSVKGIR